MIWLSYQENSICAIKTVWNLVWTFKGKVFLWNKKIDMGLIDLIEVFQNEILLACFPGKNTWMLKRSLFLKTWTTDWFHWLSIHLRSSAFTKDHMLTTMNVWTTGFVTWTTWNYKELCYLTFYPLPIYEENFLMMSCLIKCK